MEPLEIIKKYYKENSELYNILVSHSIDVTNKALTIISNHPELNADKNFVKQASMLHDIGIFLTDAKGIKCHGIMPYLCHGYLGREILELEGYPRHALVCERHTGTGLCLEEIKLKKLPLPHRDMNPISIEEKIICFADCFYSKTNLGKEKTIEQVRANIAKYNNGQNNSIAKFEEFCEMFL